MCVASSIVLGVNGTSGSWTARITEVISAGDPRGPAHHGVAHALGHAPTGHPHGGGHVGGPYRGHGGSHRMVGRVQRLHWRPGIEK